MHETCLYVKGKACIHNIREVHDFYKQFSKLNL